MIFDDLRQIQENHGYLPGEALRELSSKTGTPLYHIHGLASFYPHFHLSPPARAEVRVCCDMSCHLRGGSRLRDELRRRFRGLSEQEISLREVSCLGRCDRAPALSINDHIYEGVSLGQAESLVEGVLRGDRLPEPPVRSEQATLKSDLYQGESPYQVLRQLVASRDWDGVIAALKDAQLRGLGGAGFPTGLKWEIVRNAPGEEKYVVCNADESEPGTIKDRFIMQQLPQQLIEGVILAGLVTGARRGYIYIRHEYEQARQILAQEIQRCRREGLLGERVLGTDLAFELDVFVSPGGYICGEESALLEAMEGKRAEPRNKPPFPGTHGLWNKPTVINNVETLVFVPLILARGVEWFKAQGEGGAPGLKFVGISGHVRKPGVYEIPMGAPASRVILELAGGLPEGKRFKAFAPSGPSSGYLPASMADVRLDFKSLIEAGSMLGSGAVVVCSDEACMLDMALDSIRFFRNESCGKCVPCRVGSQKLVDLLGGWTRAKGSVADQAIIEDLSHALTLTSICGLGQVVPAPIASVLKHFREEVEDHFLRKNCPAGVCSLREGTPV